MTTKEAQSEAPSVDDELNKILGEFYDATWESDNYQEDKKCYEEAKAKINRLIVEARIDELEHLKEEPLFKRKVVDTEDLRRRTGYVRCRVRVKGLIDSRIAALSNNLSKGDGDEANGA